MTSIFAWSTALTHFVNALDHIFFKIYCKNLQSAFSNPKYLMRNENRSNLRINLIVLKKKDKQEKEVEIPLETKKIELSLS